MLNEPLTHLPEPKLKGWGARRVAAVPGIATDQARLINPSNATRDQSMQESTALRSSTKEQAQTPVGETVACIHSLQSFLEAALADMPLSFKTQPFSHLLKGTSTIKAAPFHPFTRAEGAGRPRAVVLTSVRPYQSATQRWLGHLFKEKEPFQSTALGGPSIKKQQSHTAPPCSMKARVAGLRPIYVACLLEGSLKSGWFMETNPLFKGICGSGFPKYGGNYGGYIS